MEDIMTGNKFNLIDTAGSSKDRSHFSYPLVEDDGTLIFL
jgi:hypothetical protein